MKHESTPVRIPNAIVEVVLGIANLKQWSRTTTVANLIKTSPLYSKYLTLLEKNKETA